ncbi:MAG: hypothetical protein AAF740_01240 [Bacteroidota bacterium]
MKKGIITYIILALLMVSCQKGAVKTPEAIGKQVFRILQKLETASFEEYQTNFVSLEYLRYLSTAEKVNLSEKVRIALTGIEEDKFQEQRQKEYDKLKAFEKERAINWSEIEYGGFTYESEEMEGILRGYRGKLIFSYRGQDYSVETTAMGIDSQIKLFIIDEPQKE